MTTHPPEVVTATVTLGARADPFSMPTWPHVVTIALIVILCAAWYRDFRRRDHSPGRAAAWIGLTLVIMAIGLFVLIRVR